MFRNHLKIAFRNLAKRKGYTLLNIFGLAIGICCCLLIFQYVAFERSYDRFEGKSKQIVRLRLDNYQEGKLAWQSATVYPAIAPAMKRDYPEVEQFCRMIDANMLLSNDERNAKFLELKGYYAEPSVLDMFAIKLVKGDPKTALDGPNKLVISQTMAKKYFGSGDPIGKNLTSRGGLTEHFEVTGVFQDFPQNSHLIINHLLSFSTLVKELKASGDTSNATETSYGWYDFYDYLQLRPGTDYKKLEAKLPAFSDKYMNSDSWRKANNVRAELYLIPLRDIHLYSNFNQEAEVNGDGKAVGFLFLIAFFIIVIAWINYSNLATARSLERAREVGVRKVLGAIRWDLVGQFLVESFLLNLISVVLALLAALILTKPFNVLIGTQYDGPFRLPLTYSLGFAAIFGAGTLVSGLYPAFVLSGFRPIAVLKGIFKNSSGGQLLRKGLIVGQFATSVILIAGTIIVYQQVRFMRSQKIGANINQTLVLKGAQSPADSLYQDIYQPFKTSLLQQQGIRSVTASTSVMGDEIYWTSGITRAGKQRQSAVTLYHLGVDYDFLPAYDLKLLAGRNFSKSFATDKKAVLINESALHILGFSTPESALNEILLRGDSLHIIGVIADYHHQGLRKAIDPMLILLRPDRRDFYSIKLSSADPHGTIASVEKAWNRYFPSDPFTYFFLDQSFDQQYKADSRFGTVFGLFASLAILIACFGLLGLSAYNVLQRTKEIGIRKVLGASPDHLVYLLSKEFLVLVLISLVLAIPLSWWVMHNWLQDFAYRISIQWWVFFVAGILALGIALLTVGFQALRAAFANPVKSLRTE
jgi:putative ABC transport system permease protein